MSDPPPPRVGVRPDRRPARRRATGRRPPRTPRPTRRPGSRQRAGRTRRPVNPGAGEEPTGTSAAQQCTTLVAPGRATASSSQSQRCVGLGRCHRAVPAEAAGGRHCRRPAPRAGTARRAARRPARRRSGGGRPPRASRTPSASDWARSRRAPWSARTWSPRGRSTSRGQGPRPGDLDLDGPAWPEQLLGRVEVLSQQRPGPPLVGARARRSRQPAGCRSAPSSPSTASVAADHRRRRAAARAARGGTAGRRLRRGRLRSARAKSVAGHRADAGGGAGTHARDAGSSSRVRSMRGRADDDAPRYRRTSRGA